ncbi:MAG: PKD domain-containing protein, partial [Bacteroidales bacterium]|nr:PKD domain-containing protein [Bacteroidales bacterium]
MRKELFLIYLGLILFLKLLPGQDCSIISKANDITPDRLCSPVSVDWVVSFRGVNNAGTSVKIRFDWDDGSVETFDAVNVNPDPAVREWAFTASHTYTSDDNLCNYHPEATLIVNGQLCTSSSQEQIVTVWDNDNTNGGRLRINPAIYPICFGNGANVRFQDNTRFNCVPPQERDVPNVSTRWIQWIYGTASTMTGQQVTINGNPQAFPYRGNVITLPGPVTGSGQFSDVINVADDKLIGQFFEVTLRYWNYCNPYDDPLIPGPPADPVNGDNDPMTTTARILIVPYPDATIDPVAPVCESSDPLYLKAADAGGQWSGNGITNATTGEFDPETAGVGDHIIRYEITDGNKCSDWDTVVVSVRSGPDATITPVPAQCNYHIPFTLTSAAGSGTWSGTGITDTAGGIFSPAIADTGSHLISFFSDPDQNGCVGEDQLVIRVHEAPAAEFLTDDSAWCVTEGEEFSALIKISGSEDMDYDLVWQVNGTKETIFDIGNDTLLARLEPETGMNTYRLMKITENFGDVSCERTIDDLLRLEIWPGPEMSLDIVTDGFCSPVGANITGSHGNDLLYKWNLGDGAFLRTDTAFVYHTYFNTSSRDTLYSVFLTVENQYGCVDSIRKTLPVYPNPVADFLVYPQQQNYPETTVEVVNFSGDGNWQYFWNFGDGSTSDLQHPGEYNYNNYGEFQISLKTYSSY